MGCMKCGREVAEQQVFCESCLEEMKKHPVKPNATVQLPPRTEAPVVKKKSRRHRDLKAEDLVRRQKITIRCLFAALAVTIAAFAITATMLLKVLHEQGTAPVIGQNYGTIGDTDTN